MKRHTSIRGGLLLLATLAGSPVAGEEAASLSLDTVRLEGWEPTGPTETYIGDKLYEAIDGFADYHFGFDFREAQRRFFTQGLKKIEVFVYRFGSPTESFGLYSVMRPRWGQPVQVDDEAVWEPGNVCTVWRGPYYIAITTQGAEAATEEDLTAVARTIVQPIAGAFNRPDLVRMLPPEHLQSLSVLYFHCLQPLDRVFYLGEGNVLQLAEKPTDPREVEAVYAEYDQNGRPASVVVARYPHLEKARKARDLCAAQFMANASSLAEESLWEEPPFQSFGRGFQARTGFHTLLFQRENWLLVAAEVVDLDLLKGVLTKIDQALWKQREKEQERLKMQEGLAGPEGDQGTASTAERDSKTKP